MAQFWRRKKPGSAMSETGLILPDYTLGYCPE